MKELNGFVSTCINTHQVCGSTPNGAGTLPTPAPIPTGPGDINGDEKVDAIDLSLMLTNWGSTYLAADQNNDGVVDIGDLSVSVLLSHWTG
jgi:hypothetical protein